MTVAVSVLVGCIAEMLDSSSQARTTQRGHQVGASKLVEVGAGERRGFFNGSGGRRRPRDVSQGETADGRANRSNNGRA